MTTVHPEVERILIAKEARSKVYRRILMPIDGSACSEASLSHGLQLAKEQGAEVKIIHVLDIQLLLYTDEYVNVMEIEQGWRRAGQGIVDRAAKRAREAGVNLTAAELIDNRGARISDVIVGESKRWATDLIVMGTHGRHGIDHLLLGSVAEGIVRTTSVPVLLIRKE